MFKRNIFKIFYIIFFTLALFHSKAVAFTLTDTEDVESRDSKPRSLTFNNDGTKFYIASASNKEINVDLYPYNLSYTIPGETFSKTTTNNIFLNF